MFKRKTAAEQPADVQPEEEPRKKKKQKEEETQEKGRQEESPKKEKRKKKKQKEAEVQEESQKSKKRKKREREEQEKPQRLSWRQRHRRAINAFPFILLPLTLVFVLLAVRIYASRSMEEYVAFYGSHYDAVTVTYGGEEVVRTVTLVSVSEIFEDNEEVPVAVQKQVLTLKDKKSAKAYAEKLSAEDDGSYDISAMGKYVIIMPKEFAGDVSGDKYKTRVNNMIQTINTRDDEGLFRAFVSFGNTELSPAGEE